MATLNLPTGRLGYGTVLQHVLRNGIERRPRGLLTYDVGHTTLELLGPYNALPIGVGRNLSRRVAAAEAVQLIGGFADPELLLHASPNFKAFIEPSGLFHGAYGDRIGLQLPLVLDKLRADSSTRQAVIALWDPRLDNDPGKRDYPCTLSLVFSTSPQGFLELDVTMRSNDVWRGLPYDLFQFSQLQLTVARLLALEPGAYRHHTHSLHLYADDAADARRVVSTWNPRMTEELPSGLGVPGESVKTIMNRAMELAYSGKLDESWTESEQWYWHALQGHKIEVKHVPPYR